MKCTNNIIKRCTSFLLIFSLTVTLTGCSEPVDANAYQVYDSSYNYGITRAKPGEAVTRLFSDRYCVVSEKNVGTKKYKAKEAGAAALFNDSRRETVYAKNVLKKMYPASTTKILTAMIALEEGDPDEVFTVSENACRQSYDSSVAGLSPGDKITLNDLLYGLMLASGNDAAVAIAEGISGNVDDFAEKMNQYAKRLGATHSHFVNPNGLHEDDHYTCVYDMYLIFTNALDTPGFEKIISTVSHKAECKGAAGEKKEYIWNTTNLYLRDRVQAPEGVTVVGGKTGTTNAAGCCLVLYSNNENDDRIISIVFAGQTRYDLYNIMNKLLKKA